MALIANANLPPAYLAAVVNANLPAATDEMQAGDSSDLAGLLVTLAANPAAARIVFTGAPTGPPAFTPNPNLVNSPFLLGLGLGRPVPSRTTAQIIDEFDVLAGEADAGQSPDTPGDQSVAAELGNAYAAAAGADDETDGKHSAAAANFALTLITTLPKSSWSGNVGDLPTGDDAVPAAMKPYLCEIAGSYATEFTVAARDVGLPVPPTPPSPG